ncbi:DUF6881 domain-containing protein [Paenibacillus sp. L3-i20]|uniref:DUF6881 domain-containing protein n=1 Tax=Paenibacillus sp. L3-i20 TaxID=2905833 RepID=UPI001EDF6D92|nr:hypothetical protein [Paenibacillus sp. L3-i20]GKU76172.1 hypothetical protein L3i20_v205690 [Paenibacillus sp. L3-i20]
MRYWYWKHHDDGNILPRRNYVEMDEYGYEIRKVVYYRNNEIEFADEAHESERTWLGVRPLPGLSVFSEMIETAVTVITKEQFEKVWEECN